MIESESVLKFIEEKKNGPGFSISADALNQLIPEEYNAFPVCILCIMGASRCGKSFFLNFVIRYLESLEKTDDVFDFVNEVWEPSFPKWMVQNGNYIEGYEIDGMQLMTRGFSVRGGDARNTTGILFWNHPFLVTKKNGDTVCILVMDTQGLWDEDTPNEFNSCIFGLSSILSSYLIFNHKGALTVENLKLLSNLSVFSKGITEKDEGRAFQHLDILFRDHPNYRLKVDDASVAEELSREKLEKLETKSQMKTETEKLKKCFESFNVFCLPKPGDIDDLDYDGRIDTINTLFLQVLGNYIERIVEHIEPRKLDGQVMTGETFKEFALGYAELFSKRTDLPDSGELLDVTFSVKNTILRREGMRMFEGLTTTQMEGTLTDAEFEQKMNRIEGIVLEFYDANARGSGAVATKERKELERRMKVLRKDWQVRRGQEKVTLATKTMEEERQQRKEQERKQRKEEQERRQKHVEMARARTQKALEKREREMAAQQQNQNYLRSQMEKQRQLEDRKKKVEELRQNEERKRMEREKRDLMHALQLVQQKMAEKQKMEEDQRRANEERAKIQQERLRIEREKRKAEEKKQGVPTAKTGAIKKPGLASKKDDKQGTGPKKPALQVTAKATVKSVPISASKKPALLSKTHPAPAKKPAVPATKPATPATKPAAPMKKSSPPATADKKPTTAKKAQPHSKANKSAAHQQPKKTNGKQ